MDVRTVTDTSYSFKLSDVDTYLAFNNASPVTATVLPDLSGATPRLYGPGPEPPSGRRRMRR